MKKLTKKQKIKLISAINVHIIKAQGLMYDFMNTKNVDCSQLENVKNELNAPLYEVFVNIDNSINILTKYFNSFYL